MAVWPARAPLAPPRVVGGASLRGALVLLGLAPITVLLGTRLHRLGVDPILGVYTLLTVVALGFTFFLAFARYRDPSLDPPVDPRLPSISCLVAVKDEIDVIDRCIASLLGQTYRDCELFVVDDGSTDGTTERLRAWAARDPRLTLLVNETSQGKKRALTRAAAHARGDLFVFTDSDCELAPDAVDRLVAAFRAHPQYGALSGHARALNADDNLLTRMQDTWYETSFSVTKAAESVFGGVTCVSGPLAAFRREAIYNYLPAWAQDTFLGKPFPFATDRQLTGYVLGARERGEALKERFADSPFVTSEDHPVKRWEVGYVHSARVTTAVPDTARRLLRQQIRWKKSFVRNLFFTGSFYWRRGAGPSFLFYTHSLFVMAAPVMVARHLILAPVGGAAMLAALYVAGVFLKGSMWAVAYRVHNPGDPRWVYRPLMNVVASLVFSWMLLYSVATLQRGVWARG
jgi:cellulose synthase/poly-beta-1,6-N-acetylglucosamine synthase-like glycosyltransferase